MKTTVPLHLLYDKSCPICRLEMHELEARDTRGRLRLVDISAPGFDPAPWSASLAEMNALLHAVDAAGVTTTGVPALRLAYDAVGLGAWFAPTRWPLLAPLFGAGYRAFARHRYVISRVAAPLVERIESRRASGAQLGDGHLGNGHIGNGRLGSSAVDRRAADTYERMRACTSSDGACDVQPGSTS